MSILQNLSKTRRAAASVVLPWPEPEGRAVPAPGAGELWLMALSPQRVRLSPLHYRALTVANVVIYDRTLAGQVAAVLPLGGYAEPAAAGETAAAADAKRCLGFALDGWSVVRVIDGDAPDPDPAARLRSLAARLLERGIAADLPARVFAFAETDSVATTLGALVARDSSPPAATIAFARIGSGLSPKLYSFAANGLAG